MKNKIQRYYSLGSEWLYYKLYMGSQTSEIFLTTVLHPIVKKLLNEKIIDKWFFINYNDPNRHIRVRFHLKNKTENLENVIRILNNAFSFYLENKLISDINVGLYKRELERYGNHTINEFETLFFLNTTLICDILSHVKDYPDMRWLWCMKTIDSIMDDWGINLINKKSIFEYLKTSFGIEMNASTFIDRQLSMKYRNNRKKINNIMENDVNILSDLLLEHSKASAVIINNILVKRKDGLIDELTDKLESYIHMHCNRFFSSRQRLNEWVIYVFLYQYYRSQVAQGKF